MTPAAIVFVLNEHIGVSPTDSAFTAKVCHRVSFKVFPDDVP